MKFDGMIPFL